MAEICRIWSDRVEDAELTILGIEVFSRGRDLVNELVVGGLVQVPSGPGLAEDLPNKSAYREALLGADYVIPDSGLMVLVWNLALRRPGQARLERYSGLRFLRDLLPEAAVKRAGASFWVMPTVGDQGENLAWLRRHGHEVSEEDCYVAPYYRASLGPNGEVEDADLLARIEARRPAYVFVNVGSGVQEQLGWYLRKNLSYRPAILCTGAAIAFLTGRQAPIPPWADRLYLGWLIRILRSPKTFGTRYLRAFKLIPLMLRYRDRLPEG